MGLVAQLFGYGTPVNLDGERSLTELLRRLGAKSDNATRLTTAYMLSYAQEAMDKIADSDWDAAERLYEIGIRQIPQGIVGDPPFSLLRAVLSYNAFVCKLMRDGLTQEHEKELASRIHPSKGLFSGPVPAFNTST